LKHTLNLFSRGFLTDVPVEECGLDRCDALFMKLCASYEKTAIKLSLNDMLVINLNGYQYVTAKLSGCRMFS